MILGRTDPDQSGVDDLLRKEMILCEKSPSRMDGIRFALQGGIDDLVDVQIGFGGRSLSDMDGRVRHKHVVAESIRSAVDNSGIDLPVTAGVYDPDRRNPAICNQYSLNLPLHPIALLKVIIHFNIVIPFIQVIVWSHRMKPSFLSCG